VLGVVPYYRDIRIAQEDSVYLDERVESPVTNELDIAVIRLPHVSNYDDFDPLEDEGCRIRYVTQSFELGNPHLIILPGTKSTGSDLQFLKQTGLAGSIISKAKAGTPVVGICGGYQMLGQKVLDPQNVESAESEFNGLGLLDAVTTFATEKSTRQVRARVLADSGLLSGTKGQELSGYEIHMGQTVCREKTSAFQIFETPQGNADYVDGALNAKGNVLGTYLHGLFYNDDFRQAFLNSVRHFCGLAEGQKSAVSDRESPYDKLAELVRRSLNMTEIYKIIGERG
jgi:adenosylcobyric acid synthase